jgi:glucose-6-phosphate-specific signal transduction histidine kinase
MDTELISMTSGSHRTAGSALTQAGQKSFVSVDVDREGERLLVTIEDDGSDRSSPLIHLADRIGALGGSLEVSQTTLRAAIPCE